MCYNVIVDVYLDASSTSLVDGGTVTEAEIQILAAVLHIQKDDC